MLKQLYDAIRKDAAPTIIQADGREYSDRQLYPVHEPQPQTLVVSTLTGLVDYMKANIDTLSMDEIFCHVVSPAEVAIRSSLQGNFCDRSCYIRAELNKLSLPVNEWIDAERFTILMQACFVNRPEATDRDLVLQYISNVTCVNSDNLTDDGITQAVTIKKGIAGKAIDTLPNPVTLCPYRTYTEVEQPPSQFVFRARQKDGVQFMLVEADGGAWQSEAMKNIQQFMRESVPDLTVIA